MSRHKSEACIGLPNPTPKFSFTGLRTPCGSGPKRPKMSACHPDHLTLSAGMGCRHDFRNHYVGMHARACVCTISGGNTERGMVTGSVIAMRGATRKLAEGLRPEADFLGEEEQKTGGSVAHVVLNASMIAHRNLSNRTWCTPFQ